MTKIYENKQCYHSTQTILIQYNRSIFRSDISEVQFLQVAHIPILML